jgi:hypothetical protein
MIVSILLFLVSLIGAAIAMSSPVWSDLILLAGPSVIASIFILFAEARKWINAKGRLPSRSIVIDGSNVMYWHDGTPRIECVQEAVRCLAELGFRPGVMFDANAGHLLAGTYRSAKAMSKLLDLPLERVMVVPKGSPADPYILKAAREMGAPVISNDRFREWARDYPEVAEPGHVVGGGYRQGRLWFDFDLEGKGLRAA